MREACQIYVIFRTSRMQGRNTKENIVTHWYSVFSPILALNQEKWKNYDLEIGILFGVVKCELHLSKV